MPRSCTSCASQLLDHVAFCTICGSASAPVAADSVGVAREPKPESSMPGGAAGPEASATVNPANRASAAGAGFQVQIAPAIATCGMLLAVFVGVGVTAIDYPAHGVIGARYSLPSVAIPPVAAALPPPVPSVALVAAGPPSAAVAFPKHEARRAKVANARKGSRKAKPVVIAAVGQRPAVARAAPSIDERYQSLVQKECPSGIFGILCGESVRWRLCDGRWNEGDKPGETRCQVGRKSREGWDQINSGLG